MEDGILPMFKQALEHEYHYPPQWGSTKLNWADFDDQLSELYGKDFSIRYMRRKDEYEASVRIYCKHKISARNALGPGEKLPNPNVKLALGADMIEVYKGAGHEMFDCGGFLRSKIQAPNTIIECWRCGGEVCAACELPIYSEKDKEHDCNVMNRADNLQEEIGQRRGRDIQQCPKEMCRNIIALKDGCNHMVCNKCSVDFCFICGEGSLTPDHFALGSNCPRYNHPDDEDARFDDDDEVEVPVDPPAIDIDDPEWQPLISQLRYLVMYRIENGIRLEEEWLYRVLRALFPDHEDDFTLRLIDVMFQPLAEIEPRPPLVPGVFVPINSQRGRDEVAMRVAEWLTVEGERRIPQQWWRDLVQDLEQRDITAEELVALVADFEDFLIANVIASFNEGFFDLHTHNAEPEVTAFALRHGLPMDDEEITNLMRLYDDLSANLELADLAVPDEDQVQDFYERHRSIEVAVQKVESEHPGVIVRFMPYINECLEDYVDRIPDWSGMNPGLLALEPPEGWP